MQPQYTSVPLSQVIPVDTDLPWEVLGALPEMVQTATRLTTLKEHGVDHPLLDDGEVASAVRGLFPDGVAAALDLVGTPTLPDTLGGTGARHGLLLRQPLPPVDGAGLLPERVPPRGVRLAGYFGDAADLPETLQEILDAVAAGLLPFLWTASVTA